MPNLSTIAQDTPQYTISQAAELSGISAKMIRYYEKVGLLPTARRTTSGYRYYSKEEVHTLEFVRHSRDLGFSVKQIGELLALWWDKERASAEVKALARGHLEVLQQKLLKLEKMTETLRRLVTDCHGDDRPDCPILAGLEGGSTSVEST